VLVVFAASALFVPFAVPAQPRKPARIGFLYFGSRQSATDTGRYAAFLRGMRDVGYEEGKDFVVEARYGNGKGERLAGLAADLLKLKVDVIVATGTPAAQAAQRATSTLPIVITVSADPVADGFALTLAKPGGNITGLSASSPDLGDKYFEILLASIPKLARVAVLLNPANHSHAGQLRRMREAAQKAGVRALAAEGATPEGLAAAFAAMESQGADACIILPDTFFVQQVAQLAKLAADRRLPSIYLTREYPEAGGMMSFGPDINDNFRRAASYVERILKGAQPQNLPIEQPAKFELVVNLKTAKALGVRIPPPLLVRADRVIE
jgi:putative ABC transport system substrate-binding protein